MQNIFSCLFILILGLNLPWTFFVRIIHQTPVFNCMVTNICFHVLHCLCRHRYREKSGHEGFGHQHKQALYGCVWMWRESHHHCVWSAAWAEQEEEGVDWRRDPGGWVCLHGLFPRLKVSDRSGRWARLDTLSLDVGKEEGDGHCENKQQWPYKPGKHNCQEGDLKWSYFIPKSNEKHKTSYFNIED